MLAALKASLVGNGRPGWRGGIILAGWVGLADFLSHPGVGAWPFGLIAFLPLLAALDTNRAWICLAGSFLGGLLAWSLALHWLPGALVRFAEVDAGVSWVVYGLTVALQASCYAFASGAALVLRRVGWPPYLAFGSSLALVESCLPQVIPYSHAVCVIELAAGRAGLSFAGRAVTTFLVIMVNWGILVSVRRVLSGSRTPALIALAGSASILILGAANSEHEDRGVSTVSVGFLQSKFDPEVKRMDPEAVFEWHSWHSRQLTDEESPDFLVWGETVLAVPALADEHARRIAAMDLSMPLVFGVVAINDGILSGGKLTNSVMVAGNCNSRCRYDKQRLVPIAESTQGVVGRIGRRWGGPFDSGSHNRALNVAGIRVGTPICFESIFPALVASFASDKAQLLVAVESSSWLGSRMGQRAMEGLSRLSAIEHGLPLLRVVDGGPSSVWSMSGSNLLRTPGPGQAGYFHQTIELPEHPSFFSRHERPIGVFSLAAFLLIALVSLRRGVQSGRGPESDPHAEQSW